MPNSRQMVVATIKDLTTQCLRDQMKLKMVLRSKAEIEARERQLRAQIRTTKLKVNRELRSHGELLGVNPSLWEDIDGEEWKQIA